LGAPAPAHARVRVRGTSVVWDHSFRFGAARPRRGAARRKRRSPRAAGRRPGLVCRSHRRPR